MQHCPGDAPGRIRRRQYWRAAATRPHSGTYRRVSTRMMRVNRNPTERERRGALPPRPAASGSQGVVRTVAERFAASRLAPAEPNLLGDVGGKRDRGQPGAFMRAVAE